MPVLPVRRLFKVVNGGTPTADAENWGGDVAWATPVDLGAANGQMLASTERALTETGLLTGSRAVPGGSLLISTRAPIGYVAETSTRTAFNQGCRGLVPIAPLEPRFFRYQFSAFADQLAAQGQGSTFLELSGDALADFRVVVPQLATQRAVADYLDRETVRIDALITATWRMAELLNEKRLALVTHAVTKGLEPSVPMKDSGVRWLGEIPAHWDVTMLKRVAGMRAGHAITSEHIDSIGRYPVYGGNGIRGFTDSFTHEGTFPLVGRQGALCGCVNFATGKFWASEHAVVATAKKGIDPHWLSNLLDSLSLNSYSHAAAQPGLAVETIEEIMVPRPPLAEQRAIADYVGREVTQIDALIAAEESLGALFRERRQALIGTVVTGQLAISEVA